jgi:hypothetical protein
MYLLLLFCNGTAGRINMFWQHYYGTCSLQDMAGAVLILLLLYLMYLICILLYCDVLLCIVHKPLRVGIAIG